MIQRLTAARVTGLISLNADRANSAHPIRSAVSWCMTDALFDGCRRVGYCDVVEPDNVLDVLWQYDALLLPTYQPGEGYPGVIIEACAVGLPVICTLWHRLPELVDGHRYD